MDSAPRAAVFVRLKTESEKSVLPSRRAFANHGASSPRGVANGEFAKFRVTSPWRMNNINDLISHGERAATNMVRHVRESRRNAGRKARR
jgi:hypothetical protein